MQLSDFQEKNVLNEVKVGHQPATRRSYYAAQPRL